MDAYEMEQAWRKDVRDFVVALLQTSSIRVSGGMLGVAALAYELLGYSISPEVLAGYAFVASLSASFKIWRDQRLLNAIRTHQLNEVPPEEEQDLVTL